MPCHPRMAAILIAWSPVSPDLSISRTQASQAVGVNGARLALRTASQSSMVWSRRSGYFLRISALVTVLVRGSVLGLALPFGFGGGGSGVAGISFGTPSGVLFLISFPSLPFPSACACTSRVVHASFTRRSRVNTLFLLVISQSGDFGSGNTDSDSRLLITWWFLKPGTHPKTRVPHVYFTTKPRVINASSTREKSMSSYGKQAIFNSGGTHLNRPSLSHTVHNPANATRMGKPVSCSNSYRP